MQIRRNVSQNTNDNLRFPYNFTFFGYFAHQSELNDPFLLISCTSILAVAISFRWHPCQCQMFVLTIAQIHHVICSGSSRPILSDLSKIDSQQIPASPLPVRSHDPVQLTSGNSDIEPNRSMLDPVTSPTEILGQLSNVYLTITTRSLMPPCRLTVAIYTPSRVSTTC